MTKIDAKRRYRASAGSSVRQKQSSKASILLLFGISLTLSPAFAQAQEFDIDAGPAVAGLSEFAAQADVSVVYTYDAVDGLETNKVEGVYEPDQALQLLLAGTGLSVYEGEGGAFAVEARGGGGDSDSKNFQPTPVLMAQNQTSQTQTASSRNSEGGTGIVTGKVTDARTGANLEGAQITIKETRQWTSTNDLGEFRFVNVPIGRATLTVSYLGYAGQSAVVSVRGDSVSQSFALRGGSEMEEIVVFGQRSARALALNQERTAENFSTVITSDLLGQFPGTTISDSLRRAPGISFQQDGRTGDGTNVIVRGLAPDFNTVTLNGVRLPEGSGMGRAPDLSNILTESISKITINKTLLPSQDSSGTGGLIDIETKGPLERGRRFASLRLERNQSNGDFRSGTLASGTVSGTFGANDNFGLSAAVQYRDSEITSISYDITDLAFGQYLPLDSNGSPILFRSSIDPRLSFPFESGVSEVYPNVLSTSYRNVDVENLTLTLSGQSQIGGHTDLRIDFVRAEEAVDSFDRQFELRASTVYELLPIDELSGETRAALVWEDAFAASGFPGGFLTPSQTYEVSPDTENITNTLSLQGTTNLKKWEFEYSAGYASGDTSIPNRRRINLQPLIFGVPVDLSFLQSAALDNLVDGRVVSPFARLTGDTYPVPLLDEQGFAFYNNPATYQFLSGNIEQDGSGSNDRLSFDLSAKHNFESNRLKHIEVGVFYEDTSFKNVAPGGSAFFPAVSPLTAADIGLARFSGQSLSEIGLDGGFDVASRGDIVNILQNFRPLSQGANPQLIEFESILDSRVFEVETTEKEFSAFAQARYDVGRLEVIGGLRFVSVDIKARNISNPTFTDANGRPDVVFQEAFSRLINQRARQTDILPRVLFNYRQNENVIVRGGFYRSVARPQIGNLSRAQSVSLDLRTIFGPQGNQPILRFNEGNPDLEPAYTDSFDIGFEYYDQNVGVIKASVFYKEIENFLEFNVTAGTDELARVSLPDDPRFLNLPDNIFVQGRRPFNSNDSAEIWGYELVFERQFSSLPGALGGLGLFSNYTYTDSSKTQFVSVFDADIGDFVLVEVPNISFNQQPEHSGTLALTYSKYGVDASLAYTAQSERRVTFDDHGLSRFAASDDSLDLRVEYRIERFGGLTQIYFNASDLLKGAEDSDIGTFLGGKGDVPKIYTGGRYLGGRNFSVGLRTSF